MTRKTVSLSILLLSALPLPSHGIIKFPNFESEHVFNLLKKYMPENPIILEAGAYTGNDTAKMASLWPKGTIHAFEPIPDLFNQLDTTTRSYANVKRYPLALSTTTGTADFYVSACAGTPDIPYQSGSLLQPKEHLTYSPGIIFPRTIKVPTVTIDEWAEKNGVDHVDVLWLDMQGHELPAIKASPKILATVKVIYTEIEFVEAYAGQPLYQEIRNYLEQQGFVMVADDFGTCSWFGNAFFVRASLLN